MGFKTKIASVLILFFGLQIKSNGQTITFNILKKMVASGEYKELNREHFQVYQGSSHTGGRLRNWIRILHKS